MSRRIARREWAWALTVAAVTVALSSIPYVAGYLSQTPDHRFIGAVYDWEDYYSHLAKMQQGMRGAWDYHILFTPEDHPGAPINTFYIALGHLTGALGLSPLPVYHLTRIVCAIILLATVYGFIGAFVPADGRRTGDHGGGDHGGGDHGGGDHGGSPLQWMDHPHRLDVHRHPLQFARDDVPRV